eukprot:m.6470 g.6470  ORF g.6470 m.6470 type:complete len:536 (+) comp3536_c0_seq1:269-1876(+)
MADLGQALAGADDGDLLDVYHRHSHNAVPKAPCGICGSWQAMDTMHPTEKSRICQECQLRKAQGKKPKLSRNRADERPKSCGIPVSSPPKNFGLLQSERIKTSSVPPLYYSSVEQHPMESGLFLARPLDFEDSESGYDYPPLFGDVPSDNVHKPIPDHQDTFEMLNPFTEHDDRQSLELAAPAFFEDAGPGPIIPSEEESKPLVLKTRIKKEPEQSRSPRKAALVDIKNTSQTGGFQRVSRSKKPYVTPRKKAKSQPKSPARQRGVACSPADRRPYSPVTPNDKNKRKKKGSKDSTPLSKGSKSEAGSATKALGRRIDRVEDTIEGYANLRQLHLVRGTRQAGEHKRPLLDADLKQGTDPVTRVMTSNKMYKGRFFNPDGTCQKISCILFNFPRQGRGNVRLQLKAWNSQEQNITGSALNDDTKAQFLSYIAWVYGISSIKPANLGQWANDLSGHCDYCRTGAGSFHDDEFVCVNPFHYVPEEEYQEVEARVLQEVSVCLKENPVLPGERPAEPVDSKSPKSRCYCPNCRLLGTM